MLKIIGALKLYLMHCIMFGSLEDNEWKITVEKWQSSVFVYHWQGVETIWLLLSIWQNLKSPANQINSHICPRLSYFNRCMETCLMRDITLCGAQGCGRTKWKRWGKELYVTFTSSCFWLWVRCSFKFLQPWLLYDVPCAVG